MRAVRAGLYILLSVVLGLGVAALINRGFAGPGVTSLSAAAPFGLWSAVHTALFGVAGGCGFMAALGGGAGLRAPGRVVDTALAFGLAALLPALVLALADLTHPLRLIRLVSPNFGSVTALSWLGLLPFGALCLAALHIGVRDSLIERRYRSDGGLELLYGLLTLGGESRTESEQLGAERLRRLLLSALLPLSLLITLGVARTTEPGLLPGRVLLGLSAGGCCVLLLYLRAAPYDYETPALAWFLLGFAALALTAEGALYLLARGWNVASGSALRGGITLLPGLVALLWLSQRRMPSRLWAALSASLLLLSFFGAHLLDSLSLVHPGPSALPTPTELAAAAGALGFVVLFLALALRFLPLSREQR